MTTLRRVCIHSCLVLSVILAAASIAGSTYRNPEAARTSLFASPLAIPLWFAFLALSFTTIAAFRSIRRSLIQAAVHLAPAVIVIGAMWGSIEGLGLRERIFGSRPISPGNLIIGQGERERRVIEEIPPEDPAHAAILRGDATTADRAVVQGIPVRVLGELPFEIELERFWVEWYDPEPTLLLEWRVGEGEGERSFRQHRIPVIPGRSFPVSGAGATVAVLEVLPSAKEEGAGTGATLEFEKDGATEIRKPVAGDEIVLERFGLRIRVVRVFSNFRMRQRPEGGFVYDDAPGPGGGPACHIEILGSEPGDEPQGFLIFQNHEAFPVGRPHGDARPALPCEIRFRMAGGTGRAIAAEGGVPAARVRVAGERGAVERWLFLDGQGKAGVIELAAEGATREPAILAYYTAPPPPKEFLSKVVVWEDGERRAEKIIEVNDPLHYGGYHFYQSSYDARDMSWSLFQVVPDSGLPAVYIGFIALFGGLVLLHYVRPVVHARPRARRTAGTVRIEGGLAALRLALVAIGIGAIGLGGSAVVIIVAAKLSSTSGIPLLPVQVLLAGELVLCLMAGILFLLGRPRAGRLVFGAAFVLGVASFVLRWITVDHIPMQSMFEVMLSLAMCVFPVSLILAGPMRVPGQWIDPLLAAVLLVPPVFGFFDPAPQRLPPALQSSLFLPHVAAYMLAYAAMFKAAVLGALAGGWSALSWLLSWTLPQRPGARWGQLRNIVLSRRAARLLERGGHAVARLGFPLLTAGLLLGSWWAKIAWGDYWSWDPKELWSLATWLAYVAYFHVRIVVHRRRPGLQGWLLAAGGVVVLATLLWVNLSRIFGGGLHSYAS
ncbi:MAG: cytochrome c biogenesis protein CcsA [Planctomycetes bacterium]|nr:cytochrome c biogenesis protein CcsA [Planctomycetota bacterium]